jgi:hypothetical protein
MKRIFAYILITAAVLSLGMVIARRIGAAQPPLSFALLFTNPDGTPCKMPCMLGIRVGETPLENALVMLRSHSKTHNQTWDLNLKTGRASSTGDLEIILSTSEEKIVTAIEMYNPQSPTLVDVIVFLGAPEAISLNYCYTSTSVYYAEGKIFLALERAIKFEIFGCTESRLGLGTELTVLIISTERVFETPQEPLRRWLGFASMSRYFAPTPQP